MSRYQKFDDEARIWLQAAVKHARSLGAAELKPEHLLPALAEVHERAPVRRLFDHNRASLDAAAARALQEPGGDGSGGAAPEPGETGASPPKLSPSEEMRGLFDLAESLASASRVRPLHLLKALHERRPDAVLTVVAPKGDGTAPAPLPEWEDPPAAPVPAPAGSPAHPSSQPQSGTLRWLTEFGREVLPAGDDHPIVGRDREIDAIAETLQKCFKPNPVLVGEAGVGKTALVEGLAARIRDGKVPERLRSMRIFEIRLSELLAGAGVQGSYEERLKNILAEAEAAPDVILFVDEIHTLMQEGRPTNPADVFKPALARGSLRCIGATTTAEYHQYLAPDEAISRRFQPVHIAEPDSGTTETILRGVAPRLSSHHRIEIDDAMLAKAVRLAGELLVNRKFPDKALDLLDQGCAAAKAAGKDVLEAADLQTAAETMAGIAGDIPLEERLRILENSLLGEVFGQDGAVRRVNNALQLTKRRLDLRPWRPDGVFLFTGPPGTGKSALARAMAKSLAGSEQHLFTVDMGEFHDSHTLARLVGSPPGYIGYREESLLARAANRHPFGVLLLDEFDKAAPAIHQFFLGLFETGSFTDAGGRTVNLSNMTIVATANVRPAARQRVGFAGLDEGGDKLDFEALFEALAGVFPRELLSRFDEIIPFAAVDRPTARRILRERILTEANRRRADAGRPELELDPEAEERILEAGHSTEFGVRNLQREFERQLVGSLT